MRGKGRQAFGTMFPRALASVRPARPLRARTSASPRGCRPSIAEACRVVVEAGGSAHHWDIGQAGLGVRGVPRQDKAQRGVLNRAAGTRETAHEGHEQFGDRARVSSVCWRRGQTAVSAVFRGFALSDRSSALYYLLSQGWSLCPPCSPTHHPQSEDPNRQTESTRASSPRSRGT